MSQEPNSVLQNALDAVDRLRIRVIAGLVLLFLVTVFSLGWFMAVAAHAIGANQGQTKLVFTTIMFQMFFVGICTGIIAFQVTRMTKTVLKAIEVTSKR